MATRRWLGIKNTSWDEADNWSGGAVPVSDDTVVFPSTAAQDVRGGENQVAVEVAGLTVESGCSIDIGTPDTPIILSCKATGAGWRLNGSGTCCFEVRGNDDSHLSINGPGTVHLLGSYMAALGAVRCYNPAATVYIGWNVGSGRTPWVDTISNQAGATLYVGELVRDTGDTHGPEITVGGGATTLQCDIETLTQRGGTVTVLHGPAVTGTVSTATVHAGTLDYRGDRTITTLNIHADGAVTLDESPGLNAGITTVNIYGAGRFSDPHNANPVGTAFNLYGTDLTDSVNFGRHRKITIGSI